MSEVRMHQCEVCKKRVENHYAAKDWLHFSPEVTISKSIGRMTDNSFKSVYKQRIQDLCSLQCFKKLMEYK